MSEIQVSDRDLFEIIGRSQVEIFSQGKELEAYRVSMEKVKSLATEVETLRAAKAALETSNKQLADKNIQLDQVLTEARKDRDALRVDASKKATEIENMRRTLDEAHKNEAILSGSLDTERARSAELQGRYDKVTSSVTLKKSKK